MRRRAPAIVPTLALALAGPAALPVPAAAQQEGAQQPASAEEVRLRREVADLREQLARAQERIRRLEEERGLLLSELRALREGRAAGGGEAADGGDDQRPREPRAEIPEDPFAAPAAMLRTLRERYQQQFENVPHDTEPAIEDYRRDVQQWIEDVRRELRSRTTWLVRIHELQQEGRDRSVVAQVIDEESGLPIGDRFTVEVDSSTAAKVERGMERFDRWNANVVVSADPQFNPERTGPGVFEHPPYVGRYVDFGIDIDWRYVNGERTREEAQSERQAEGQNTGGDQNGGPRRDNRDR